MFLILVPVPFALYRCCLALAPSPWAMCFFLWRTCASVASALVTARSAAFKKKRTQGRNEKNTKVRNPPAEQNADTQDPHFDFRVASTQDGLVPVRCKLPILVSFLLPASRFSANWTPPYAHAKKDLASNVQLWAESGFAFYLAALSCCLI